MSTTPSGTQKVVTRLAPSPTGMMHIGTARAALFNWLFTKHTGGTFLLRIEDTDRERSKPEYVDGILDGLRWLGLDWDGEPIFQFARADRHREVGRQLLADGKAYNCYLTPAELDAMREKMTAERDIAKKEGRPPEGPQVIESPWRDRDPEDAPTGVKPSIRLKTRRDGETVTEDQIQGRVVVPNKDLDDMIILRSDGAPTYNFAVVVDDHDMAVTHVIRGVDHLTNTARQIQVYQALGWPLPLFAHMPLVHGADGAKLSKRHGAQGVAEFRAMGYLPAALRNYLVRLGWSHGDDEIISTEKAIAWFDIKDVNKSPGRFDFKKLADLNGHYIRGTSDADLLAAVKGFLPYAANGEALAARFAEVGWEKLAAAMPSIKDRAKTLPELIEKADFLLIKRPIKPDEKAAKLFDADAKATLAAVLARLEAVSDWQAPTLEAAVRAHGEAVGAKLGDLAAPLRIALSGKTVAPPIFDVLAVLGREEALARIRDSVGSTA